MKPPASRDAASRLGSALLVGALAGAAVTVVAGFLLRFAGARAGAEALRRFLVSGGWLWVALWGAALGALSARSRMPGRGLRLGAVTLALVLAFAPLLLRPVVPEEQDRAAQPRTAPAKATALRRWAYRSPESVGFLLPYVADRDPIVREQAALALGINLIVSDIEHAGPERPARFAAHPLRDSLRIRLRGALLDPVEGVRAEAARALLKAPITFGRQPEAADSLAAVLDRSAFAGASGRAAWLALDATASSDEPRLRAAAVRFARRTTDSTMRRTAQAALNAHAR